jgi:hypothetical protein
VDLFAVTNTFPSSIAWLVRENDWETLEKIIYYNSATLGGYFNSIVPVSKSGEIPDHYVNYLRQFDPDFIIFPPDAEPNESTNPHTGVCPFALLPWGNASQAASLDPEAWHSVPAPSLDPFYAAVKPQVLVAVETKSDRDSSLMALLACGDILYEPSGCFEEDRFGGLNFSGYRGKILRNLLRPELQQSRQPHGRDDWLSTCAMPDRVTLKDMITPEHQFPLTGAANILRACQSLQLRSLFPAASMIGLTAWYVHESPLRNQWAAPEIGSVFLLSEHLGFEQALLFWNLRAAGTYVAWLPFSQMEAEFDEIARWLGEEEYGFEVWWGDAPLVLAAADSDIGRAEELRTRLDQSLPAREGRHTVVSLQAIVPSSIRRPSILGGPVIVSEGKNECAFVPTLPPGRSRKMYCTTLEWDRMMVPPISLVQDRLEPFFRERKQFFASEPNFTLIRRFRITKDRYLSTRAKGDPPIHFERLSATETFSLLFQDGRYERLEPTSTARYHLNLVERSGGLENACRYLSVPPYRELLSLLADNGDKRKPGWLLENPAKRRALNHLDLRMLLGAPTPSNTHDYFKKECDILPAEARELLSADLLERGFWLRCETCSFHSWYRPENVGHSFECQRCGRTQPVLSNPIWLYKLPEVVFQGFQDNMQVPLLAINCLRSRSKSNFEWIPERNVFWRSNGIELSKNVDLLCLSDGRSYIGEAKLGYDIEGEQFSFYEELCQRIPADGIVFATAKTQWGRGTLKRIGDLAKRWSGEVIVLTGTDLYGQQQVLASSPARDSD